MGLFGGMPSSQVQPLPPAPAPVPTQLAPEVEKARADQRRLAALAAGRTSTILTTPQGLQPLDPTQRKTLLGQ